MIWILLIAIAGLAIYYFTRKKPIIPNPPEPDPLPPIPPEPIPDPVYYKWQLVNKTTERWARYVKGMEYVKSDSLMALEMIKKDETGKKFYVWTAEAGDYWDLPDEVYEIGKVDCDGFARLTADGLARFAKFPEVYWMEYYGYYTYYYFDRENDRWATEIRLGGHAITVYVKDGELKAFSNTQWWDNKNFQDYISIGEMTFPEGLVLIRCRHWETGILKWIQKAPEGEIFKGSCVFDRNKVVI